MKSKSAFPLFAAGFVLAMLLLWLGWSPPALPEATPPVVAGKEAAAPARPAKNLKEAAAMALAKGGLEDFDKRFEGKTTPPLTDRQRLALEALRREVPDVQVEFDAITGSPRSVMSNSRFLTQSEPMPHALSYEQGMAKVKAYVNTHRSLFLHGGEVLDAAKVTRQDTTAATGLQTLIWEQKAAGVPVYGSFFKANLSKSGEIMMIASEMMTDAEVAATNYLAAHPQTGARGQVSVEEAVAVAAASIGKTVNADEIKPAISQNPELAYQFFDAPGLSRSWVQMVWLPVNENTARLAWEVNVESALEGMFNVVVDAESGEAVCKHSMSAADSVPQYLVFPDTSPTPMSPGFNTPAEATTQPAQISRQLIQIQSLNPVASPNGWINDNVGTTTGNNVDAYADRNGDHVPDSGSRPVGNGVGSRTFDPEMDLTQDPSSHISASIVELFYTCNWAHDRLYSLGFTESAGNFQANQFNRNGVASSVADPLLAEAQKGAGIAPPDNLRNNAFFSSPQDGINPRMEMYVFSGPTPDRDACFDKEVVLHEYAHGVSNRLAGTGSLALKNLQSQGMGEGWSDFYAQSLVSKATDDPNAVFPIAAYSTLQFSDTASYTSNYYFGIRRYPKSTDMDKSPLTFKDIDPDQRNLHVTVPINPTRPAGVANQSHNIGEVWSSMLWEIRARMIDRYGWAVGNEATLQLVTDGLKQTPANPNFIEARDAILLADLNSGGTYRSIIWRAFAKRGLGFAATSPNSGITTGLLEDYTLPGGVDTTPPVVTFAPLVNQQSFFEFSDVGPQALGGTVNEASGAVFFIEEYNTNSTPNRFWNGSAWVTNRNSPGTRLPGVVTGGTWKPAPGLTLPLSSDLRNGYYLVTVRVADDAGNATETNIVLNRTVNAEVTPPVAAISAPLHNSTIAGFGSLTGTASDPVGGSGLTGAVTLTITNDGEYWSGSQWQSTLATVGANVLPNGTWNCTLLPAGPHFRTGVFNVTAQAFDWAGNASAIQSGVNQITFTVDPSLDTTAPAPVIASPTTGSVRSGVLEITGTATDSGGAGLLPIVILSIQQGSDYWTGTNWSSSLYSHAVPVATDGSWRFSSLPRDGDIRAGLHLVTAICYDYGGNVSTPQSGVSQVSYMIDTIPPTGTVTHPQDQAHYAAFPAFNGTAEDASGIQTVLLYIRRGRDSAYWTGSHWDQNAHALSSQYDAGTQTFTSTFTPPSVGVNAIGGTYYYDAIAVDAGGLYTQFGSTVIIDYTATFTWTGASLAGNNLWGDSSNWSSTVYGFIPGPDDIAIINSGSPATFAGENISVRELRLNGGTLTAGTIHVGTAFQLNGGTFHGALSLEPSSLSSWTSGTLTGSLNVALGATLKVEGNNSSKLLGESGNPAVLNNFGTIQFLVPDGSTTVARITGWNYQDGNPTINNKSSGVIEIVGNGSPLTHYQYTEMDFINEGRIVKTAGTGSAVFDSYWVLDNRDGGIIESAVQDGSVQFSNAVPVTFRGGSVLRGPGTVRLAGGLINTTAGTWNVDGAGTLLVDGSTMAGPQAGSLTLTPSAGGTLRWLSGTIHGNVTIPAGATLNVEGDYSDKNLGASALPAVLDNFGTMRFLVGSGNSEVARITGWNYQGGNPTINNKPSGVFEIEGDGSPLTHYQFTAMFFNNEGRIVKTAGTGISHWNSYWSLDNAAGAVIESATPGGTVSFASPVPTTLQSGTILRGPGSFLMAGGTIMGPAGTWTVDNSGALLIDGASLDLPLTGSLAMATNPGSLTWLSGTIHGNMTIPAGTTLNVEGAYGDKILGISGKTAALENFGSIRFLVAVGNSEVARITGWNYQGGNPTIINQAGGVFSIEGDGTPLTSYQDTNMSLQNAGRIVKTAGTGAANINGYWPLTNSGTLAVDVGTLDLNVPVSFNHGTRIEGTATSQCRIVDNTTSLRGTTTIASGRLVQLGGLVTGHADGTGMIDGGTLEWAGGTLGGTLHFASTANVAASGVGVKTLGANAILNNAGNFTWSEGSLVGGGNSGFTNLPGGTFNAPAAGSFSHDSGGNVFANAGTMNIGASPGTLTFSSAWAFVQTASGVMNIELGGTSTTQYDRLLANGPVTLGGTMNVTAIDSFVPASGNTFNVMTFASRTGSFAAVNSGSMLFTKTYDSTSFTLTSATEPTTYAEWKDLHFGPGSLDAGDLLDPDNDGIPNLLEYAMGGHPREFTVSGLSVTAPQSGFFDVFYNRKVSAMSEVTFQVEWKDDVLPGIWSNAGITESVLSTTNGVQRIKATVPAGTVGRRFSHLRVTIP